MACNADKDLTPVPPDRARAAPVAPLEGVRSGSKAAPRLYQTIARRIAADVRCGRYVAGQRLPTARELAQAFEVSRATIIEAMIALESIDVVRCVKGSGIFVIAQPAATDDTTVFHVLETCCLIEPEAAALAATSIGDDDMFALTRSLWVMRQGGALDDRCTRAEHDFHATIARSTNNPPICGLIVNLWGKVHRNALYRAMLAHEGRAGMQRRAWEFGLVLDALRHHDPSAARLAMQSHLKSVANALLNHFEMQAVEQIRSAIQVKRAHMARSR